ncbi:prolyl 4-hydroxylase subunit alpha-2 isoform X2 [Acyrthosiphon pisum]|uniref:procollagen-proline 4-dioxygenase n=1 Tax=Acyrthosiphon pisum TaxID=7029 RepID=A0A8R1VZS2_ACYPI|nr:prolyl 4-hydroxylase subunit alpha-2 isoform X2 [Acyrthosiphon pisum]|eukprot:XP_001945742.2 PREDICTED: prolyl 4-hydroxylase subunit alpha-2 isoform X2 [Acyrthosiphon pisum]
MLKYLAVVSSLLILVEAIQRWHTSQIMLTKLYDVQNDHFNILDNYVDLETKRLEELKNYVAAVYEWRDNIKTKKHFLHDHMDVFKVMTQMLQHYFQIDDLIKNKKSLEAFKDIDEHKDLSGEHIILLAHRALRRLQLFYAIPASDMSAGRFNEKVIGDRMDACECCVMAKYCLEGNDPYGVLDWAVEAYGKWESEGRPECVDPDILNYYIVSSSVYTGFNFMNLIILSGPNYQEYTEKCVRYYHLMKNELFELEKERTTDIVKYSIGHGIANDFRNLCKHGVSRTLTKYSKCRYQTNNLFYRILMPFKEEDINSEPLIKIYHDVLYDDEILKIKTLALEKMKDAKVKSVDGKNYLLEEKTRSGQVYWIFEVDAVEYFDALNTRIESFTGFSTKTAERYQIVNYGLGGHYIPHHDSFAKGAENVKFGNRLVTVLFYLTDVQNDGYTSFPMLNIIAPAEKGAALVWNNLHMSNGQKFYETLHGSCPLLKGNKWIMTRWLYEEGQHLPYNWKNK